MMYRLDLADSRLDLPAPVYRQTDGAWAMRDSVKWKTVASIPFFALPSHTKPDGSLAIYQQNARLTTTPQAGQKPLFHALAPTSTKDEKVSPAVVPLYEYTRGQERWYSINPAETGAGVSRTQAPLCRVWRNPSRLLPLDFEAQSTGGF